MKLNLEARVAALELLLAPQPKFHVIDASADNDDGAAAYAAYLAATPEDSRAELVVVLVDASCHL